MNDNERKLWKVTARVLRNMTFDSRTSLAATFEVDGIEAENATLAAFFARDAMQRWARFEGATVVSCHAEPSVPPSQELGEDG